MAEGDGEQQGAGTHAGTPDVFISHASQDVVVADAVVTALERQGLKCWIAPRDVVPGALYADGIVRAINAAKIFVLVLSAHSVESPHVGREIERACAKRRPIIALRTDSAPLTPAYEYFLSESQWIDLAPGGTAAATAKLVEAVRRHLSPGAAAEPHVHAGTLADRPLTTSLGKKWMVIGAAAILSLALGFVIVQRFRHSNDAAVATSAAVSDKSIAVLPFVDMSEKKDQEYFADGMAEEIIDLLSKVPGIRVIGRTSSFQFKGKSDDLRRIGSTLGSAYVVEGSVRKSGDRLRVTAQLIGVRDGSHLWSETYDENTGDVLQVQDRISSGLVRALQVTIGADDLQARPLLKNADAYDLYLRGRYSYDRFDEAGFASAASFFQRALALDPGSVRAAEWLALTYESNGEWGFSPPREAFEKARTATLHALELDPRSARAHATMCAIHTIYDWDWDGATKECRLALDAEPSNPYALSTWNQLLIALLQVDAAKHAITDSLSIDPMDASTHVLLGNLLRTGGELGAAEAEFRKALDISPGYVSGHWFLGLTLLGQGKVEVAQAEMQREVSIMGRDAGLAIVYHAMHRDDLADAAIAKVTDDWAYEIASFYAYRAERARALEWLNRAYDQKDPSLAFIKTEALFHGLVADPGFKALLRKMNLPE